MIHQQNNKTSNGVSKTTVIGIIIVIIILGGIILIARPSPQTNNTASLTSTSISNGVLVADETNFNFGSISMADGKVKHAFKIKNTGSDAVTVEKMYTSCMCTTATLEIKGKKFGPYGMQGHGFIPKINENIGAGEEAVVEVVFDPAAHGPAGVGRIQRAIIIENNSGQQFELAIEAFVTP